MTRQELSLAQFLLSICQTGSRMADERDPGRTGDDVVARKLDGILRKAADAFITLTGRHPSGVSITELNTTKPSAWARSYRPEVGDV